MASTVADTTVALPSPTVPLPQLTLHSSNLNTIPLPDTPLSPKSAAIKRPSTEPTGDLEYPDQPKSKKNRVQQSDMFPAPSTREGRLQLLKDNAAEIAKLEAKLAEEMEKRTITAAQLRKPRKRNGAAVLYSLRDLKNSYFEIGDIGPLKNTRNFLRGLWHTRRRPLLDWK